MIRKASLNDQIKQHLQHILGSYLVRYLDAQAFPAVLVDDVQHPQGFAITCPGHNEVIAPDMVPVFRPKPDARTIIQP